MARSYTPKILVVDDVEENLLTLKGNLRGLNAEIITACSGKEALLQVLRHDFALLILDVQKPEMNGYETAERIRLGKRNKYVPIIFLTAIYYDQGSVLKGYNAGAVDYLTKPFNREILISKVNVFLDLDQIKNELIESKKEFQLIVQDQTDLICRTDQELKILFANRSLLVAFTKTFESIKDQNILDWVSQPERGNIEKSISELTPSNAVAKIYHSIRVSASRNLWVSTIIRALYDPAYELTGYQLVMRDVTSEVNAREELLLAKETAEKATRSKSQFLANMSHEIRTPMNSIIGMIDVLYETNLDEDQREDLEVIKFSANKLLDLLNDILDFSKIEANQIKIEKVWFNLADELNKTRRLFEIKAKEKGIELSLDIHPDVPANVKGDPLRTSQIINNLLNNALKFTKQGKVAIAVEVEKMKPENNIRLQFKISDTGIGMPENIRNDVFEYFNQGDSSITREYGGTGLGLSISKSLCELMGGTLSFKSNHDKGTTFWFCLEYEIEKMAVIDDDHKYPILVVDDNEINRKVICSVLKKNGFNPEEAENGKIALDKVKQTRYGLVIMDIQMPVMDGFTASQEIRLFEKDKPDHEKTKIIALTANATREDQEKSRKSGMDGFLTKPLKFPELEGIMKKLFHKTMS